MKESKYISYNGKIILTEEFKLEFNNRAFQYGDGLFETMHALGSEVQFFYEHMERLISSMKILKMEVPVRFSIDTLGLQKEITKLLTKNRIYKGGRVRMTVFRQCGGFYSPETNEINYLIRTEHLKQDQYVLNTKGFNIDIFEEIQKPANILSGLKTTSSILYVMAGIFKSDNKLDECLIINEKGNIVEGISSNIFIVKEKNIYTPSLKSGCLDGIMRKKIIDIAKKEKFTVFDDVPIKLSDIMAADELFFTNAITGIRWVLSFKQRRFYNKIAKQLNQKLNETVFSDNKIISTLKE
ncbi:MAG: aminotransferase class IV [Bacteroidota bacterium]